MKNFTRGLVLFFLFLGVYLWTMAPSITPGDSGEFCAGSVILGIPHSPGYPLYCLAGKIFVESIPFGSYAYRVNFLSVFFASLTVAVVFFLMTDITGSPLAAVFSSLMIGLSQCFWKSSIQAEVFALNTFLAVFIIMCLYRSEANARYAGLACFVAGIALGNHHTIIFVLLIFAPVYLFPLIKKTPSRVFVFLMLFLLGMTVYAYLPARSLKNPGLDWGNPETLKGIYRVFSRKDYGTFALTVGDKLSRGLPIIFRQVGRYFAVLAKQVTLPGIILCFTGLFILNKTSRRFCRTASVFFLISGIGFMLLANLPFDPLSDGILERFYILPMLGVCIGAGMSVAWFLNGAWFLKRPAFAATLFLKRQAFAATLFLIPVFQFLGARDACNWRNHFLAYDYGRNILRTLIPGSVFFMDGGDDTFYSMAYLCFAEGRRRDAGLHDRGGLVFKNIYGDDFRSLSRADKESRRRQTEKKILDDRPVFYSTFNRKILPGVELYPAGITFRAGEKPSADAFHFYTLNRGAFGSFSDYRSRALAPVYAYMCGVYGMTVWGSAGYLEAGPGGSGGEPWEWFNYAFMRWGEIAWLKSNIVAELHTLAYELFNRGDKDGAQKYYERILRVDEKDVHSILNLGVIAEQKGMAAAAERYYRRVIEIDPSNADAYYNLGVLYWKQQDWQKVLDCFKKVLWINPGHEGAKRFLPQALLRAK
ncbi:MAG: DUF2723 domain-containing protein [Elusimicrobia bacterium]|nr:DUF2723 domain-containing protein [Elusimicrobiota bacterium]